MRLGIPSPPLISNVPHKRAHIVEDITEISSPGVMLHLLHELTKAQMVVSQNRGPQCRPQNTIILIIGTPKKVPLILGNPKIVTSVHLIFSTLNPELLHGVSPMQIMLTKSTPIPSMRGFRGLGLGVGDPVVVERERLSTAADLKTVLGSP